jgi:hypothetical protein
MKRLKIDTVGLAGIALMLFIAISGCQKPQEALQPFSDPSESGFKIGQKNDFTQVNLDADVNEYDPLFIDPKAGECLGTCIQR